MLQEDCKKYVISSLFVCVIQMSKAARIFQDAEDVTYSGKAVAWLAAGTFAFCVEIPRQCF